MRCIRTGVARVDNALASVRTSGDAFIYAGMELCVSVTAGLMVALIWHMITAGYFEALVSPLMPGSLQQYLATSWMIVAVIVAVVCIGASVAVCTVLMIFACVAHFAAAIVFLYSAVELLIKEWRS